MISILGHSADKTREEHGGLHCCRRALPPYTPAGELGASQSGARSRLDADPREQGPRSLVARGNGALRNPLQKYIK